MEFEPLALTERCRAWLAVAVGDCSVGDPLPGATTATVVPVRAGGRTYVLKWFTWAHFVAEDPERVAHELHGLELAHAAGVPSPVVVAADEDGSETGHPALLMTAVPGRSLPRPAEWPELAARAAIRLHDLDAPTPHHHVPFFPQPFTPHWAGDAVLWRRALAAVADLAPCREAIIHRDLHRWNMHWHRGRLSGVVDWLSACRGPVGEDVGRVWINEILEGDPDGGAAFRSAYVALAPRDWDARWEIQSALDMLPAYISDDAVHSWGNEVRRGRFEECLRFGLGLL